MMQIFDGFPVVKNSTENVVTENFPLDENSKDHGTPWGFSSELKFCRGKNFLSVSLV